MISVDWREKSY